MGVWTARARLTLWVKRTTLTMWTMWPCRRRHMNCSIVVNRVNGTKKKDNLDTRKAETAAIAKFESAYSAKQLVDRKYTYGEESKNRKDSPRRVNGAYSNGCAYK